MKKMLSGDTIQVSESAREIAHALFSPTLSGRALYAGSVVGIGLLPYRLKKEFGLPWSLRRERWLLRSAQIHRGVRRHVPSIFCASPVATFTELVSGFDRQFAALHR
jgi:uncharacterized protein (DUF2236 family)